MTSISILKSSNMNPFDEIHFEPLPFLPNYNSLMPNNHLNNYYSTRKRYSKNTHIPTLDEHLSDMDVDLHLPKLSNLDIFGSHSASLDDTPVVECGLQSASRIESGPTLLRSLSRNSDSMDNDMDNLNFQSFMNDIFGPEIKNDPPSNETTILGTIDSINEPVSDVHHSYTSRRGSSDSPRSITNSKRRKYQFTDEPGNKIDFISSGFHAYQRAKVGAENTKIASFNERKLFVTNNNKTGILYIIFDKGTGNIPCNLQMWGYDRKNEFESAKRVYASESRFPEDTAFLQKVISISDDRTDLEGTPNIAKDTQDGSWTPVRTSEHRITGKRSSSLMGEFNPDINNNSSELLATTLIQLPSESGRYAVIVYPLKGLKGVKGARSVERRGFQRIAMTFHNPSITLKGPMYKICTKDNIVSAKDQSY